MRVIEISCAEVWREISNYVDDEVDPELRARIEAHLKMCAHCTAVLDGAKNVVKLVAEGVEYDLPDGFSRRLYWRIMGKQQTGKVLSAEQRASLMGSSSERHFQTVPH